MINPVEDFAYIGDENHALTPDERRDIARCIEDQGAGIVTLLIENAELRRQLAEATQLLKEIDESEVVYRDADHDATLDVKLANYIATAAAPAHQSKPEQ